eukprot:TRINITY_DN19730_c0_g1_i2.p1 TRINITY_DN19730_c0_g1~~TRINITY_DN19730_c0_g1_i2.p1  ORF type:complete len:807 (+),score=154.34 TRINITY_DN19730_c0_g1_i2:40-2421(+)
MPQTDRIAFMGGVAKSLEALVDILEVQLYKPGQCTWPEAISGSTQGLKSALDTLQEQLRQAAKDCPPPEGLFPVATKLPAAVQSSKVSSALCNTEIDVEMPGSRGNSSPQAPRGLGTAQSSNSGQRPSPSLCHGLMCPGLRPFAGSSKARKGDDSRFGLGNSIQGHADAAELDSNWSEHLDPGSGQTYYFNRKTRESTWDKPMMLGKSIEASDERLLESNGPGNHYHDKFNLEENSFDLEPMTSRHSIASLGSLPEKTDDQAMRRKFLFNPSWTSKMSWDFFVMFLVICDAIALPYQLSFKHGQPLDGFDEVWFWITFLTFTADIAANFNTAIEVADDEDTLITDRVVIAKKYGLGWFSLDFVSTIPWSRVGQWFGGSSSSGGSGGGGGATKLMKVMKFLRIMRLMRMLRMAKLKAIYEGVETYFGTVLFVQSVMLLKIICTVIAICHWNACIFWMVGSPDSLITDMLPTSVALSFRQLPHWTTVPRKNNPSEDVWTWLDKPISEAYVFCFYWTLGVMRTMPAEVTPVNLAERVFVLLFMFFALSAFAISVGSLTQAYFKIAERSRSFNEEMFAVRMHLKRAKMDNSIQRHIKQYLNHLFERRRIGAKEASLIDKLPDFLKEEIDTAKKVAQLMQISVAKDLSKRTLVEIAKGADFIDQISGETICVEAQEATAAWVLVTGRLLGENNLGEKVCFRNKDIINEDCLMSFGVVLSSYTVQAAACCELLKIHKERFVTFAFKEHPDHPAEYLAAKKKNSQIKTVSSAIVVREISSGDVGGDSNTAAAAVSVGLAG